MYLVKEDILGESIPSWFPHLSHTWSINSREEDPWKLLAWGFEKLWYYRDFALNLSWHEHFLWIEKKTTIISTSKSLST